MKELDLVMVLPSQAVLEEMQQERFDVDFVAQPEDDSAGASAANSSKAPSKVRKYRQTLV